MRALLLILVVAAAACSNEEHDHSHAARPAVCEEIGKACHDFENTAVGKECHESAHVTWDAAKCTAERARCLAACVATDTGAETAADAPSGETTVGDSAATDTATAADSADAD